MADGMNPVDEVVVLDEKNDNVRYVPSLAAVCDSRVFRFEGFELLCGRRRARFYVLEGCWKRPRRHLVLFKTLRCVP
jgi:hypothetical protein